MLEERLCWVLLAVEAEALEPMPLLLVLAAQVVSPAAVRVAAAQQSRAARQAQAVQEAAAWSS